MGSGLHQPVPAELWSAAIINFGDDSLVSNGFDYRHVTAAFPTEPARSERSSDAIEVWLAERRAQCGDEVKKLLQGAARERFGKACTVRAFNAAYRAVYDRQRGRPETK